MAPQQTSPSHSPPAIPLQTLRARAEELVGAQAGQDAAALLSLEQATQLLHELRVHQVELEMQNDELRRVQEALLASRTLYFNLYDLAPVGYLTLDDKNTIYESNLAAATMLGAPRRVIKQLPFTRYIVADDQDAFYLYRKRLFASGEQQPLELRLLRKDGTMFWARLDASLAFDEETNQPLFLLTLVDIDMWKRQAEAMRLNAIIVDAADEAIFTTTAGPEFTITSWNPGAVAIYGWTAAEAIGQSARMLDGAYPGRDSAALRRSTLGGVTFRGKVIQTTKAGDSIHVDSRVVAQLNEQSTIVGWISMNREISAQTEASVLLRNDDGR